MSAINNDWLDALKGEFKKPYYKELFNKVNEEYRTRLIFPPADDIFNAFHLTPLSKVKVVILGQDPYHNNGQAHGLCFSVKKGVEVPPSLVNIYKELHDDLGCTIPNHGCLTKWAEQGVLMLNTVLTVRAHQAKFPIAGSAGKNLPMRQLWRSTVRTVRLYLFYGALRHSGKARMLDNPKHLILKAPHPSPLSAYRGFFGSKAFQPDE